MLKEKKLYNIYLEYINYIIYNIYLQKKEEKNIIKFEYNYLSPHDLIFSHDIFVHIYIKFV